MREFKGSIRAALASGSKVIYPGQGPCRIGRIMQRVVDGKAVMFYHLIVLHDGGGELFVPVEKALAVGVRSMIKKAEIPGLLAHLQTCAKASDNWKQRSRDNAKLFASGSVFDLAEIIASLTELSETRSLTVGESGTLGKARRLLVCEISEVMEETKTAIEEQLDRALNKKTGINRLLNSAPL